MLYFQVKFCDKKSHIVLSQGHGMDFKRNRFWIFKIAAHCSF